MLYKGNKIPFEIREDEKRLNAWKTYIDLDSKIKDFKGKHYPVYDPNIEDNIIVNLASPKHIVMRQIGAKKTRRKDGKGVRDGWLFPNHLKEKEIDEILKINAEIKNLVAKRANASRTWQGNRYVTKNQSVFDVKKTEIVERMGRYHPIEAIKKHIKKQYNYNVTTNDLRDFYYKNQQEIEKRRTDYGNETGHISIARQRGRLEEYSFIYDTQKKRYEETNYKGEHAKLMMDALEKVKKEIEGERIMLDVNGKIDIDLTVNVNKTFETLIKQVPLMSFIVSLSASKQGINPMKIMYQLQKSIYARYSGVKGTWDGEQNQDLNILPTNKVYDWMQVVEDKDFEDVTGEIEDKSEKDQVDTNRKSLQEILDNLHTEVNRPDESE